MYSSDGPPSFSSAGINSVDQQRIVLLPPIEGSINNMMAAFHFQSTGDISGQLPSYGALGHGQGNSQNELLPDTVAYRGIGQTVGNFNGDKAPSFTAFGHGQGNSHNQDGTFDRGVGHADGYSDGGQAPSVGNVRHVGDSQTGGDPLSGGTAPSIGDFGRRDNSQNRVTSVDDEAASLEALVGMSLVGKNFKKFYPTAYYEEN